MVAAIAEDFHHVERGRYWEADASSTTKSNCLGRVAKRKDVSAVSGAVWVQVRDAARKGTLNRWKSSKLIYEVSDNTSEDPDQYGAIEQKTQ
jgi:hypothetical protein